MSETSGSARDQSFPLLRIVQALWPQEAAYALRLAVTSLVAIYLCMLFELDTPEWAGWTVISVTLATRASSLQKSVWRAVGSLIGAAVAIAMVDAFAQDTLAFDIALAAWLALVTFLSTIQRGQRTYLFALMGYTVPIVTLNDVQHPGNVFSTAVDRCSTLIVGVVCAYASSVLVARSVRATRRVLADDMDAAVESCARWVRAATAEPPPVAAVLKLDTAIFDAFTEQPSLRAGGRPVAEAPLALLHLLTEGLLQRRLPQADAQGLLGDGTADPGVWDRLDEARRDLRAMRRRDSRRSAALPLPIDWDAVQATRNAARAVLAVSTANAVWYVSNWPAGAAMVTWAALISILYANRDDGAEIAAHFLLGAALASAVGLVTQYGVLERSSSFEQLAFVLLPLLMLAAIGHGETKAALGGGFSFFLLDAISPKNVMTYNLTASLNQTLAAILGMGFAVASFTFLLRPAKPEMRRARARRRMARALEALGRRPRLLLPRRNVSRALMWHRLSIVSADASSIEGGQVLVLAVAIVAAIRAEADILGRAVARALFATDAELRLARLSANAAPLQVARIEALATLLRTPALARWPGAPRGVRLIEDTA